MMTTTQAHQAKIDLQAVIWEVSDSLWERLEPLLIIDKPRKKSGRPTRDARGLFNGLIWLARTGSHWSQVPPQYGPVSTLHNRFTAWVEYGCLERAWAVLLAEYGEKIGIEWEWPSAGWLHRQSAIGQKGAAGETQATGSNPTDRGKSGTKRTLLSDGKGIPLGVILCGAHRHDSKMLDAVLDAGVIPLPELKEGEERHVCLDRGYDTPACRLTTEAHHLSAHIPPKASAQTPLPPPGNPERHPPRRWVVEVGHAWFNRFRRLQTRWEKKAAHYLGFVQIAAALIIWRKLAPLSE